MFDSANRLHFATPVATTVNRKDYDRIIYAYSEDGGYSWKKANGASIHGLPMRGAYGAYNQGDVVGSTSDTYQWQVKLVPDQNGRVGIRAKKHRKDINVWWVYDGGNWTLDNSVSNQDDVPHSGAVGPGGKMIFYRNESPLKMQCADAYNQYLDTTTLDQNGSLKGYNKFMFLDEFTLRHTGSAYAIAGSKKQGIQSLVRITYRTVSSQAYAPPLQGGSTPVPARPDIQPLSEDQWYMYEHFPYPENYPLFRRFLAVMLNLHPYESPESVANRAYIWTAYLSTPVVMELMSLEGYPFLDVVLARSGMPPNNTGEEGTGPAYPPAQAVPPAQVQGTYGDLIPSEFHPFFRRLVPALTALYPEQSLDTIFDWALHWATQTHADAVSYLMSLNEYEFREVIKAWYGR